MAELLHASSLLVSLTIIAFTPMVLLWRFRRVELRMLELESALLAVFQAMEEKIDT